MNKLLWVLQVLLALAFVAHGLMMIAPPPDIAVKMNEFLPRWFQLFLGIAEVLAAVGLTLPGVTRILPKLVPAAAAGVIIIRPCATNASASRTCNTHNSLFMSGISISGLRGHGEGDSSL